jgi:hypothetical protein
MASDFLIGSGDVFIAVKIFLEIFTTIGGRQRAAIAKTGRKSVKFVLCFQRFDIHFCAKILTFTDITVLTGESTTNPTKLCGAAVNFVDF